MCREWNISEYKMWLIKESEVIVHIKINKMEEKVIALIARVLNVPTSEIGMDTEIGDLDEWDSLHNVEIIAQLENEFGVKITSDMIMDLEDVSDIVALMEELTD